jgi:acyl-coenzyme A thioesterase PaaI-like protein
MNERVDPSEAGDPTAFVTQLADSLPFNRHLDVTVREARPGYAEVALPAGEHLTNHLGSVHAVAEIAPAEAAGGVAAASGLADLIQEGYVPIAKALSVRYTKLAHGELTATAELPAHVATTARDAAAAGERIAFVLPIDVRDDEGPVAEVEVEYVMKRGER